LSKYYSATEQILTSSFLNFINLFNDKKLIYLTQEKHEKNSGLPN